MNVTNPFTDNIMNSVISDVDYREIPKLETVCKQWRDLLRSDCVIRTLIQRVFPKYNIRVDISLIHQYRRLHRVPYNILNGIFTRKVEFRSTTKEFQNLTYRVETTVFGNLSVTNKKTGKFYQCKAHRSFIQFFPPINDIQFSHDETKMVTASIDGTVKVWDPASGICLARLDCHTPIVQAVRLLSDSKHAIALCAGNQVKYWNLETKECLKTINNLPEFSSFEILGDQGKIILCLTNRTTLSVYDIYSACSLRSVELKDQILSLVSTPDGKMLLASTNESLMVMDVETLKLLNTIPFPNGIEIITTDGFTRSSITFMEFSLDGTQLALRSHQLMNFGEFHALGIVLNFI